MAFIEFIYYTDSIELISHKSRSDADYKKRTTERPQVGYPTVLIYPNLSRKIWKIWDLLDL